MLIRWKSVPVVFIDTSADNEQVTGRNVRYVMSDVESHQTQISLWSTWFGSRRLTFTLGYGAFILGLFYGLFWLAPTWLQRVGLVSFHPGVPLITMTAITVFASYVGSGHQLRDKLIRSQTIRERGWPEDKVFVWVPSEDWRSFEYDVQVHGQEGEHS